MKILNKKIHYIEYVSFYPFIFILLTNLSISSVTLFIVILLFSTIRLMLYLSHNH